MFLRIEKELYGPADFVPAPTAPYSELHELAYRNSLRTLDAIAKHRLNPFREFNRAVADPNPISYANPEPKGWNPRVLLVARITQEDPYFISKPYPKWQLTEDFFDRTMTAQSTEAYQNNHLPRNSYGRVIPIDDGAKEAEICGLLFTKFFRGKRDFEGDSKRTGRPSDWEIVSRYFDSKCQEKDFVKPGVFTFKTIFEPIYNANWPQITSEKQFGNPILGGLADPEKGRLVEDLIGNTLQSLLVEVENRHVRQVVTRFLQQSYDEQVTYSLTNEPHYFLAEQFILAGELAGKLIPDYTAPVYLPSYNRSNPGTRGNLLVPDAWIKKTFKTNQINALGELVYAASLARDDSNGMLRGANPLMPIQGFSLPGEPIQIIYSFGSAQKRALIHTALFLREVYQWDAKIHGIYPKLQGISKQARDEYERYRLLSNHPLLYDDPRDRRIGGDNPPGRGPEDDLSKIPSGPIHHLQA